MKIYLAGAIRGMPDFNVPAFDKAQAFLAKCFLELLNHEVFNPGEMDPEIPLREIFLKELTYICEEAEAIALLPGWENSKGATAERAVGLALGLKIIELDGF